MTEDEMIEEIEKLRARVDELEAHLNIIQDIIRPTESIRELTIFSETKQLLEKDWK